MDFFFDMLKFEIKDAQLLLSPSLNNASKMLWIAVIMRYSSNTANTNEAIAIVSLPYEFPVLDSVIRNRAGIFNRLHQASFIK